MARIQSTRGKCNDVPYNLEVYDDAYADSSPDELHSRLDDAVTTAGKILLLREISESANKTAPVSSTLTNTL